ncbi:hypothetical protein FPCIR_9393 [Fusarium pseudocircinatum]|uniref:Uncharacterized protein n=1 Tax=Fusarium pseudocircinatum TaxID=56676 RepID=A0A8H5L0R3_9HYPO|nr:hypothetical protein FPCIR_9393 [Fusarium pseudocircinatum]
MEYRSNDIIGLGHIQDWWAEHVDWFFEIEAAQSAEPQTVNDVEDEESSDLDDMTQEHEEFEQAEIDAPFSDAARPETPDRGMKGKARDDRRDGGTIKKQDTAYCGVVTLNDRISQPRVASIKLTSLKDLIPYPVLENLSLADFEWPTCSPPPAPPLPRPLQKLQAHHRKTATGLYEEPAFPVRPALCDISTPFWFKQPSTLHAEVPDRRSHCSTIVLN